MNITLSLVLLLTIFGLKFYLKLKTASQTGVEAPKTAFKARDERTGRFVADFNSYDGYRAKIGLVNARKAVYATL